MELLEHVEGRRPVLEALRAGRRRVHRVLLQAGLPDRGTLADVRAAAAERRVPVEDVPRARFEAMARTEAPQGVIARCDPLPLADLDALAAPPPALVLVLDGVVDPRNLGAAARAAEAAGATGVVASRHEGSPLSPAAAKASAGALEHVPVALVAGIPSALRQLKRLGVWVVALDADGTTPIWDVAVLTEPVAMVVGAEGRGLTRLVRESADVAASIPLAGAVSSLNAAAAAAVALFEARRRRQTHLG